MALEERDIKKLVDAMSTPQIAALVQTMAQLERTKKESGQFYGFVANAKQVPIINCTKRIMTVRGGNRSSKTHGVAYLDALHATGLYPDEIKYIDKRNGPVLTEPYTGLKFNRAPKMGIISVSMSQMIRGIQAKLFGPPHDFGTGLIPKDLILDHREVSKSNGCVDWAIIKHSSGGTTEMNFMYYTQEVENFQGFDWDWAHFDEQPPYPYFEEVQMRMLDRGGYIAMTYWPREERSELEEKLLVYMEKSPDYYADFMLEWWDNHYLDEDTVKMMEAVMTTEEKESRQYGRPRGVEGRIFPYIKDDFVCEPFEIEPHWRRIASLDVGFGHPTGALIAAIDDNSRTVYIYNEYLNDKELPAVHASALRGWGDVDFYTDNQSKKVSPTDGNNLFDMYKNEGLHIISAENYAGSVQTSINMVNQLFAEHRLYIFSTCRELVRQVLLYRRVKSKNGEIHIVKRDDDLVDPLRYIGLHLEKARVMGYHEVKPQPKIVEWAPVNSNIGF